MKKTIKLVEIIILALLLISTFTACTNPKVTQAEQQPTRIEMELTSTYDDSSPFIDERLFAVTENIDTLDLGVSFEMLGESGLLEIANNKTKEVLWSETWEGTVDKTTFTISLSTLESDKEYVIRFTGIEIEQASIVITCENGLVVERERPE